MDTLDKLRELNNDILPKLKGSDRDEPKAKLNAMIQTELDIAKELKRLDELKTDLAIASNT